MAASENSKKEVQDLLVRLRYGQRNLRKTLQQINSSDTKTGSGDKKRRSGEKRPADSPLCSPVKCTAMKHATHDTQPRKRARLVNLTLSCTSPPVKHQDRDSGAHRRLSSTPKTTAPSPDLSLEEALFEDDKQDSNSTSKVQELNLSQTAQDLVDGSRKRKGLSVSFQPVAKTSGVQESRRTPLHSLNTSCYGALDQQQRSVAIPRRQTGEEIQLLGYDWIAGLMDAGPRTSQFSDQHLLELREFRHVNSAECYMPAHHCNFPEPSEDIVCSSCVPPSGGDKDPNYVCMPSYVLNDRLFPIPINPNACPSCQGNSDDKPSNPPRYIQISVPHTTLQAPYKLRPRAKLKSNSAASMGLSQHCQSGWQTARPTSVPPKPPTDLKSHLNSNSKQETTEGLLNTSRAMEYSIRSVRK